MKKFYALIASASIVLGISAHDLKISIPQVKEIRSESISGKKVKGMTSLKSSRNTDIKLREDGPVRFSENVVKGMRKADALTSLEGLWTFIFGDYYWEDSINDYVYGQFEATLYDNVIYFEDPTFNYLPLVGVYDEESSTVTFQELYLGDVKIPDDQVCLFQLPFVWNYQTSSFDFGPIVGSYDSSQGFIYMEEDNGVVWTANASEDVNDILGYFDAYDIIGAVYGGAAPEPIDEVQSGQWNVVGDAEFSDGWVLAGYTVSGAPIDPSQYVYEVELQQSVDNEYIYRLWRPYTNGNSVIADVNESSYKGQIVFDVSDPDHVVVFTEGLPAGFRNKNGEYYVSNILGWYMGHGYSKEDVIPILDEGEADTFKDGVVTINWPLIDMSADYEGGYVWDPDNPYPSVITFPQTKGINTITTDNCKARYYNLQGIEIENPEPGKIYIRVDGGKSVKVIK